MTTPTYFDYDSQCWIVDGHVQRCGHPEMMNCQCYGRIHEGEPATAEQKKQWDDRLSALRTTCHVTY
jgi:hypothetical protein